MNFLTTLAKIIAVPLVLVLGAAGYHFQTQSYGATGNAGANALYEQSLAQPLGTTDANMYVTSGADVQGNLLPINSYQCLSVDTGQPNFEAICGTVTTSSTAGLTLLVSLRGLSTQTATTSNASFIFTHRRGADVRITDFPTLTVVNNELSGIQNIPNPVFYSSNFTTAYWATAASNTLVTLGQAAAIAQSGCGNASESVSGCSQLSTAVQSAAGISSGSTGSRLVEPTSLATSTPYSATPSGSVVTTLGQYISQNFINQTLNYVWSGLHTFSAGFIDTASSTLNNTVNIAASSGKTLNLNTVSYQFPSSQGSANTVLTNNGSGVLSWGSNSYLIGTTTATTTSYNGGSEVTAESITIPANTLGTSNVVTWQIPFDTWTTLAANVQIIKLYYGTASVTCIFGFASVAATNYAGLITFKIIGNGATNVQYLQAFANFQSGNNSSNLSNTASANAECVTTGTGAVDSTSNQTMKMTSTWSNQNGGSPTATFEAGVVSLIK